MALLQIAEPGQSTDPHQHRLAVGIDLGTTNSLIATVRSGEAVTLPDHNGEHLLPSVVQYRDDKSRVVGQEARNSASSDPVNTIVSAKRLIGRSAGELSELVGSLPYEFVDTDSAVPRMRTVAGDVSAVEVSAEILKNLRKRGEDALGGELTGAVITVPAYFDDAQRQATKDAARLAGISVLRLLNEPTAAAVAYGLDRGADGIHVIYDLGGGTFDVSVLRLSKGVFEVLATAGDTALGGDDMDRAITQWIMQEAGVQESELSHSEIRQLIKISTGAKEQLTDVAEAKIEIDVHGKQWSGVLSRVQFAELIEPLIKKTLLSCRRALRDAGITKEEVLDIVMVGGSTRVLAVREKVSEFFGKPVLVDIDPDKVVAIGAARQADLLVGNNPEQEMLLLDVLPLSLGIEMMGGLVEKIINRNTAIPVTRAQDFTTFKDGQTAMAIHVLQGERETVDDCRSLARFELRGIPPMVAGAARIRVTFQVDADGLLHVTAMEKTTGVQSGIEVKPSYGLTDTEIETMLRDSLEHAEDDMQARKLREQQVEGDRVIEALDAAMQKDGDHLLSDEEKQKILAARELLVAARNGDDAKAIKRAIEGVEKASRDYVARRMNSSIREAMAGHNVEEFSSE